MATFEQPFHHTVIDRLVSELQSPEHRFCNAYGLKPGGPATSNVGGRSFGWDIFNRTRRVAEGRLYNAGPASQAPNPVGRVDAQVYRQYERIDVDADRIYRKRGLGQPLGTIDREGKRYVKAQIGHQREKFMNSREAMIALMFRGGFDLKRDRNSVHLVAPGDGDYSIDFRHPSTHEGNVGGNFAGNWQDRTNAKVIDELMNLNKHSAKNSRFRITRCW